jgi:hypothetical protein
VENGYHRLRLNPRLLPYSHKKITPSGKMCSMAGHLVRLQHGDVEVWLEAVATPGSQDTTALDSSMGKLTAALDRAQDIIVDLGVRTAEATKSLASRSTRPDQVSVEFGLSFTASGGVVVMGASTAAALKVTLTYDRAKALSPGTQGDDTA